MSDYIQMMYIFSKDHKILFLHFFVETHRIDDQMSMVKSQL